MFALFLEMPEVIEGVDESGMEGVVLLGGRAPEQERVEVERDVFVDEWNGEVGLSLGEKDSVIVG